MKAFEQQLKKMEPDVRAYALVGFFMSEWARLELMVNLVVEKVLGLNYKQGAIILANIEFSRKIFILRAALHEALGAKDAQPVDRALKKISALSELRNVLAHTPFYPQEDGDGVQFTTKKAKSKLDMPIITWSVADFMRHAQAMDFSKERLISVHKLLQSSPKRR